MIEKPYSQNLERPLHMSRDLKSEMSVLTGARQTMSSWSKVIETYDAVPEVYKSFLKQYCGENQAFPYVILAPPLEKFLHNTTEKLIYDLNDAIHILERTGNQAVTKSYPYKSVRFVEVGNILLSSWITISGITSEGVASASTIEFNAATGERHFAVFLNKMRPAPQNADVAGLRAEKDKFDHLSTLNFKFMNYGRNSLVRGENVVQILLQPEIREPAWTLLGWTFYRTISPAHLTILTDKELILIREDEREKDVRGARYGSVWQYIPLRSIISVSLADPSNDLLILTITLSPDETLEKIFAVSSKPELEQFRDKIKKLAG
jgi:hypothetical protein